MARNAKRNPLANIGTVSHGTMNPDHLIPRFIAEFDRQSPRSRADRTVVARIKRASRSKVYWESEQSMVDVDYLMDILDHYAMPYFYFGAHPGDGSDYGYWLSDDFKDAFDGLKVDDTSQVPARYSGEVLHVSDHGNMTLYVARKGKLTEVWGIV